jgi:hypothetical protein
MQQNFEDIDFFIEVLGGNEKEPDNGTETLHDSGGTRESGGFTARDDDPFIRTPGWRSEGLPGY